MRPRKNRGANGTPVPRMIPHEMYALTNGETVVYGG